MPRSSPWGAGSSAGEMSCSALISTQSFRLAQVNACSVLLVGRAFSITCVGCSHSSSVVSSSIYTPFPSHVGRTDLRNSTASPYASQRRCSPRSDQIQLPRPSWSESWLQVRCKARSQSPPGRAAAATQGVMEPAEHPGRASDHPPATYETQRGEIKGVVKC